MLTENKCEFCDNKFFKRYLTPECSWRKEAIKIWIMISSPFCSLIYCPSLRSLPPPLSQQVYLEGHPKSPFFIPFSDIICGWQQIPCPSRIFKDLDARHFVIKVFQGWSLKILKIQGENKSSVFKENLNQFKVYNCWNFKGDLRVSRWKP